MGCIFIEIFDVKVSYAIYPMIYISRQYGTIILSILKLEMIFIGNFSLKIVA